MGEGGASNGSSVVLLCQFKIKHLQIITYINQLMEACGNDFLQVIHSQLNLGVHRDFG